LAGLRLLPHCFCPTARAALKASHGQELQAGDYNGTALWDNLNPQRSCRRPEVPVNLHPFREGLSWPPDRLFLVSAWKPQEVWSSPAWPWRSTGSGRSSAHHPLRSQTFALMWKVEGLSDLWPVLSPAVNLHARCADRHISCRYNPLVVIKAARAPPPGKLVEAV